MATNFVSISGISNSNQLSAIKNICLEERIDFPITIGYQVSSMSINEGTQNPRQPKFCELSDLDKQTRDYGFTTAIHYYTKDNETILEDLETIVCAAINPESLLQFNSLPPTLDVLKKVKEMGFKTILKVAVSDKSSIEGGYKVWKGKDVEDVSTGNPTSLFNQVYERREFLTYAMFDPSHGTKLELDLNENGLAVKFGKLIIANPELGHLGIIYAGGIKPNNVVRVTSQLNSFFPERFSIDIEGGIRIKNCLNLDLIQNYLKGYQEVKK